MNAFTAPRGPSLACRLKAPRILKTVERNPRYHGYYIESGAQAQASLLNNQKLRKASI